MKDFKFDLDTFLNICEKHGAVVTSGIGKMTINGQDFDVSEEIARCFDKNFL